MEVKRLLSRSVTLGQAGRFHIKWTSWNLPGGPQCPAVKPEPAGLSQLLDRVQRDVSMAGVSAGNSAVENQMHGPGFP